MMPILSPRPTERLTEDEFYSLGGPARPWQAPWRWVSGLMARRPPAQEGQCDTNVPAT